MTQKYKYICCSLLLLVAAWTTGFGQSFSTEHPVYNFKNTQIAEGEFFSNYVYDLHQDKEGYIWISTLNGLFRFDGYEYKLFKANPNQPTSISGDNPTKIIADPNHGFWVAVRPNGIVLSGGGIDYFDPLKETFTNYLLDSIQLNAPINIVNDLLWQKGKDYFWMATEAGLVQYFPATQQKKIHRIKETSKDANKLYTLATTAEGGLWVGTIHGLYLFKEETFIPQFLFEEGNCRVNSILYKNDKNLLVGTRCGLFNYQLDNGAQTLIPIEAESKAKRIKTIDNQRYTNNIKVLRKDQAGTIWVGTQVGLYRLDGRKNTLTDQSDKIRFNDNFKVNRVNAILQDQSGTLWVGKSNGISKIYLLKDKIQQYKIVNGAPADYYTSGKLRTFNLDGSKRDRDCSIKAIFSNAEEFIWVGTSYGLFQFDKSTEKYYQDHWLFDRLPVLKSKNITAILVDSAGNYWVGANNYYQYPAEELDHRLYRITKAEVASFSNQSIQNTLPWGAIKSLSEGTNGDIWIASATGLSKYDAGRKEVTSFHAKEGDTTSLSSNRIRVVFKDRKNRIWVGTADAGLNLYQKSTNQFIQFKPNLSVKNSLSNTRVNSISQSTDGTVWVGTELGLNAIHPEKLTIKRYFFENQDNKIRSILEKEPGVLMISANANLFSFNLQEASIVNYSIEDGFSEDRFIAAAFFKDRDSTLYVGGIKNLYQIRKNALQRDQFVPPLVHTTLSIKNEPIDKAMLNRSLTQATPLTLTMDQNDVSFRFAVLEYKGKATKQYRYLLEGLQEKWQDIGTKNEISFSNLQPGNYVLHVEGSNADGVFNSKAPPLYFEILPHWYWSWWSKTIYGLLGIGLLYTFYSFQLNRKLMIAETQRIQEMERLKTRLYTNITHEFRTPLTVIQGMANRINMTRYAKEKELIERNSDNLLQLVNQLLDLSKLEEGEIPIQMVEGDIIQYLQYLLESFQPLATDKGLVLNLETMLTSWVINFDKEKVRQIIFNLLINAIKFTPKGGQIKLAIQKKMIEQQPFLQMAVIDNGIGIAKTHKQYVFDRFYQATPQTEGQGTGVGLALTKELVELLGGEINLKSYLGEGCTFTVLLPILAHQTNAKNTASSAKIALPISKVAIQTLVNNANLLLEKRAPTILLVEDNVDILYYLVTCLKEHYRLVIAQDGQTGLSNAMQFIPDLIISDVLMPKMDGFELCDQLKKNMETSHIPIILLTAKVAQVDKIIGLKKGADAYLTKPFYHKELTVRIEKLLAQRRQLQAYFTQQILQAQTTNIAEVVPIVEDPFLQKVINLVEADLPKSIDLDDFSQALRMSRSQVYRKIKALTGFSPTIFIRQIRLKKAWYLLLDKERSIAEIGYQVGFKDPAFFSRSFSEVFGQTPTEFRKKRNKTL